MGSRIEVRIHAQADRRAAAQSSGDLGDAMQLGARLDVDHQDAGFERGGDFLVGLAYPGKHDLARVGADLEASHKLADRYDVEAGPHRGEQLQDAQVRQRLHRVADQVVGAGERFVEDAEMAPQRARAVHVERSSEAPGEIAYRDLLGVEMIVLVLEVIHRVSGGRGRWAPAR